MMASRQTIFALSSGQVPSGIAIVRVSGPSASQALISIAGRLPEPRVARRATLRDADRARLDEALVLWFPGPGSATGEDVAEFHVHGGRAVVAALIRTLGVIEDLRPAEPGEFSRRAFEHGKLDLVAAEALDDLIHADTEQQRRQALRQLDGLLGDRARDWRQRIIDAAAMVAASIDFSDEGDVPQELIAPARAAAGELRQEIEAALMGSARSERLRDGLIIAIVGLPNVGKSTLLNRFARRDVAIVSPYAGTTRDLLEVQLDLGGYPVTLIDTAGLRESSDPVEQEGVRRARDRAASADLVLWLSDSDHWPLPAPCDGACWRIRTKADMELPGLAAADFAVSGKTGAGVAELGEGIVSFAAGQFPSESGLITRARHRVLLDDAVQALTRAVDQNQPELMAEDLRTAGDALGRLLGRIDVEDVLDSIFARFCIGK